VLANNRKWPRYNAETLHRFDGGPYVILLIFPAQIVHF
jgi:hypothetical protein